MNAKEIKISIALVVLALALWFGWRAVQPAPIVEAGGVIAGAPAADEEQSLLKDFPAPKLIEAANMMRVAFDQTMDSEADPTTIAECSISHEEAEKYLSGLQALLDEAKQTERPKYLANPTEYSHANRLEACAETCSCAGYANLLSDDQSPAETQEIVSKLQAAASQQTAETAAACASRQAWFCKSRLVNYLAE